MRKEDFIGRKAGFLTVVSHATRERDGFEGWDCLCDCGRRVFRLHATVRNAFRKGSRMMCGKSCPLVPKWYVTHGMTGHPAHTAWSNMKVRCSDRRKDFYKNYAGRGISVCERWLESFENFWCDMGPSYREGLELDRINNDEGYYLENCRWTTRKENMANRGVSIFIEDISLDRISLKDLSSITGIGYCTLLARHTKGWKGLHLVQRERGGRS